jgi:hypothetical protein
MPKRANDSFDPGCFSASTPGLGMSRQAYYKQRQCERQRCERDGKVVALVTHTRLRQPRRGTGKLHYVIGHPRRSV